MTVNQLVVGSIPTAGAKNPKGFQLLTETPQGVSILSLDGHRVQHPCKHAPAHPPVIKRLWRAYSAGASRHRNPLRLIKIIPLNTRSSENDLPDHFLIFLTHRHAEPRETVERPASTAPFVHPSARKDHSCSTHLDAKSEPIQHCKSKLFNRS